MASSRGKRTYQSRRRDQPNPAGLPAVNRMTAAEMLAANIGDHGQVVAQILRELGSAGYLAHAEPKALAEDRYGRRGWRTPTQGPKGWPDIVAVRDHDGRIVVAEVKTGSGRPTPEQRRWLDAWGTVIVLLCGTARGRCWVGTVGPRNLQDFYATVIPEWKEPHG